MKMRAPALAGTALALVMAATYATAAPLAASTFVPRGHLAGAAAPESAGHPALLLVQAETDEEGLTEEELRRLRERQKQEEEGTSEEAPADEPAAEEAPADEAPADEPAAEQPAPEQPAAEQPAAEEPAAEEPAPEEPAAEETPAQEEAPAEEDRAVDEAPADQPTAAEPIPGQPAPPPPPPAQGATPPPAQGATPPPPPPAGGGAEPIPGQPPQGQTPPPPPAQGATPPPAQGATPPPPPPPASGGAEPIPGQPPQGQTPPPPPAQGATPPQPPADGGGAAEPVREAPLLDSEKEDATEGEQPAQDQQAAPAPAEAPPPPTSDEEAREEAQPAEVQSLRAEEGRRVERPDRERVRRERPEGVDVLREIGDRFVIQLNNQIVVQSDDRGRIESNAEEVYYEELPRGRTRETIVRPNGVQVVTIYDRYGDVVRRSRIMPDGREYVLVYAERDDREERRSWRDPGQDLPPLRLRIPRDEYILEAGRVQDPNVYYDFFEQPPVERIQRLYTVDEVRYSARVRDIARRVEMDTITFDFGSASISESAIPQLQGVAGAMERMLDENPAETFLIEGHTDAVGSDQANLALSDRRAESIATALTDVFGIPPENLVTQGYGERYLKINTEEAERANRRVVMRRITPLVAPMASR